MKDNCCNDYKKLVRWSIVSVKPGYDLFPEPEVREELISACMTQSEFETWKVAEFFERHPKIPPSYGRYVRVYSQVLRCYEKPEVNFEKDQIEVLKEIRNAIRREDHHHRVRLPKTGVIAGPLDWVGSEFGDEFYNFPPFLGARPAAGHTKLTGWVQVQFGKPKDDWVDLTITYFGVGTPVVITWGGGQQFDFTRTRTFPTPFFLQGGKPLDTTNRGRLNLHTGEVEGLTIFANFQGTTIGRTDRVNRIPYAFPYIFPPLPPPPSFVPPPDYVPPQSPPPIGGQAKFRTAPDGTINGFELHSETLAPVGLFPYFIGPDGFFPPFTFGPNFEFHFANPDRCLLGTPPADCPNDLDNPDGIKTSVNVFFHPHIDLVARRMDEAPSPRPVPLSLDAPLAHPVVLAAHGRIYAAGGVDEKGAVTSRVRYLDPQSGSWQDASPLLQAVSSAQGAVVGKHLYVLGGFKQQGKAPTDRVQVLDLDSGQWQDGPKLPVGIAEGTAAAVGKKIYVFSGWEAAGKSLKISALVQVLDTTTGTWVTSADSSQDPNAPPPASLPATGASAVARGTQIYVIGGRVSDTEVTRRTVIFETAANQWNVGPDTVVGMYQAAAAHLDGRILLIGGRPTVDGPTQPFDPTFLPTQELDLDLGVWRGSLPQPLPTAGCGAAVAAGQLVVVGGRSQGFLDPPPGVATRLVQTFRPEAGWVADPLVPIFSSAQLIKPPIAPGALVLIVGANLAPAPGTPPPGVEITVAGAAAQVLDVLPFRLVFRIPETLDPGLGRAAVEVKIAGAQPQAIPVELPVADTSPALFLYSYGEVAEPAFLLDNGNLAASGNALDPKAPSLLNYAQQPSSPGEVVTLFGTGFGVKPDPANLKVTLGGKDAKVVGVADDPSLPGVQRLAVEVPDPVQFATYVPAVATTANQQQSNPGGISIRKAGEIPPPPQPLPLDVGIFFLMGPFPGLGVIKSPPA
ncbi:MAG TPA: hypothetical protein VGG03_04380 [Thermoanaerobaculia bacterium]|jgi:uncharacterized protein (TIGR03437 family)